MMAREQTSLTASPRRGLMPPFAGLSRKCAAHWRPYVGPASVATSRSSSPRASPSRSAASPCWRAMRSAAGSSQGRMSRVRPARQPSTSPVSSVERTGEVGHGVGDGVEHHPHRGERHAAPCRFGRQRPGLHVDGHGAASGSRGLLHRGRQHRGAGRDGTRVATDVDRRTRHRHPGRRTAPGVEPDDFGRQHDVAGAQPGHEPADAAGGEEGGGPRRGARRPRRPARDRPPSAPPGRSSRRRAVPPNAAPPARAARRGALPAPLASPTRGR